MNKVLVTGATGFVGRHLCKLLASSEYQVVGTRRSSAKKNESTDYDLVSVGDIGDEVVWEPVLDGVDYVVHLAARVHVMRETADDPLADFRRVNVAGTERLLRSCGRQGVKRFILISTTKVHGESTNEEPFAANSDTKPVDPYAQSKLEAERTVEEIGRDTGFETTIIRPPLVYGPGVGGNFARLATMVRRGIPMPFGKIENLRSLVFVQNLCDLILECLINPGAVGERFLVSDNDDVSTPELVRQLAAAMSRPARLLPIPVPALKSAAVLVGRSAEVSRLTESLQLDISHTMSRLDWTPPFSMQQGIESTVRWYEEQAIDA